MKRRDTGRYGESREEAMSDEADPNYYGPDAIRFVAGYRINQAEAAVEILREAEKDKLPAGAEFYVERKEFGT